MVFVLLMSFCPPGGDDSDTVAALGIGYMQDHASAHAKDVRPLFTIGFAIVDPFDGKWISEHFDSFSKVDAVVTPIGSSLLGTRLESIITMVHDMRDGSRFCKFPAN